MLTYLVVAIVVLLLAAAVASIVWPAPADRPVRVRSHGAADSTGLPPGRIVYSDADGTARPLAARRYALTGKPDYVVLGPDGRRIPVEIKSARTHGAPRHEDVLQLVAYMIILEDLYEPAPRYGLLRYADATFEVPYTTQRRDEVLDVLSQMQALDGADAAGGEAPPGAPSIAKCRACAFKAICEDSAVYIKDDV